MRKLLVGAAFFACALGAGAVALYVATEHAGPADGEREVVVPKGAGTRTIGAVLEREGLVANAFFFRLAVWRRGEFKPKAGTFKLAGPLTPMELATALEQSPPADQVPFKVVEGARIVDVDELLAESNMAKRGAYTAATRSGEGYRAPFPLPTGSLEGYLYPETYRVPAGPLEPRELVQRQLDEFTARIYQPLKEEIAASGRTLHELVVMASLLEREEPEPQNRPLVAGVLWKRLDKHIPLGVDATSRYELESWNDRSSFLVKLRDQRDPYNTRLRQGLPPTAIGAPTLASFEASLRFKESPYFYYLHDKSKKLHLGRNAEEHEANRKKHDVY